jgi:hypothetical protein
VLNLFLNSLPLLVPLSLSPILLAGVIIGLSRKNRPVARAMAWLLGTWADMAIVAVVTFVVAAQIKGKHSGPWARCCGE